MMMKQAARPIPQLPTEAVRLLHDGTKRVSYALALEIVDELRRDPSRAAYARRWIEANPLAYRPDQEAWLALLGGPMDILSRELLRLDGRGELLRDTMPSFGAVDEVRRLAIARSARDAHS